jgi:hypothetical protein
VGDASGNAEKDIGVELHIEDFLVMHPLKHTRHLILCFLLLDENQG